MRLQSKNGQPDFTSIFGVQSFDDLSEEDKYKIDGWIPADGGYKVFLKTEFLEERLRQEFDQKLEQRVNQIAEAVASGARGQELADKMRKK